ncbi:MAG: SBBP repeat-containing protein [Gammaproteobacteria bacterium]
MPDLGGSGPDEGRAIAVDSFGNVYVTGNNRGGGFPVTAGAFQSTVGPTDVPIFVSKFDANGALVYSTYLGGSSSFGSRGYSQCDCGGRWRKNVAQARSFAWNRPSAATKAIERPR